MPNTGIKSRARCKDLETMRFSPVILTRSIYTFLCSLALRVTQVNSTCALRVYMCSTCACCVCSTCALYFFTHVLNVHSTFAPLFLNNGSHREPVWIRTTWTLPSTCIYAGLQQEAALQHPACPRGRVLHVRWQEQWRKSTLKLARVYISRGFYHFCARQLIFGPILFFSLFILFLAFHPALGMPLNRRKKQRRLNEAEKI